MGFVAEGSPVNRHRRKSDKPAPVAASPPDVDPFADLSVDFGPFDSIDVGFAEDDRFTRAAAVAIEIFLEKRPGKRGAK